MKPVQSTLQRNDGQMDIFAQGAAIRKLSTFSIGAVTTARCVGFRQV